MTFAENLKFNIINSSVIPSNNEILKIISKCFEKKKSCKIKEKTIVTLCSGISCGNSRPNATPVKYVQHRAVLAKL